MKKNICLWILFLATLIIAIEVQAQNPNSIERAQSLSLSLQKKLKLSDIQKNKLYHILLAQARTEDSLKLVSKPMNKLTELRLKLDQIDYQILQGLAERMQIVEEIGTYKCSKHMRVLQPNRWNEVVKDRSAFAQSLELDNHFTAKLLELIHHESLRKQIQILDNDLDSKK
jgi:chorismate mutase